MFLSLFFRNTGKNAQSVVTPSRENSLSRMTKSSAQKITRQVLVEIDKTLISTLRPYSHLDNILLKIVLKGTFTSIIYTYIFGIVVHFQSACLGLVNQRKYFQNALQDGKCMCKRMR